MTDRPTRSRATFRRVGPPDRNLDRGAQAGHVSSQQSGPLERARAPVQQGDDAADPADDEQGAGRGERRPLQHLERALGEQGDG